MIHTESYFWDVDAVQALTRLTQIFSLRFRCLRFSFEIECLYVWSSRFLIGHVIDKLFSYLQDRKNSLKKCLFFFGWMTAFGFVIWIMTNITIMSVILLDMISSIKLAYLETFSTWGSISTMRIDLYIDENVSCDLFLDWYRASLFDDNVKRRLIYLLISSSSQDEYVHLLLMMMYFNCSSIVKMCNDSSEIRNMRTSTFLLTQKTRRSSA